MGGVTDLLGEVGLQIRTGRPVVGFEGGCDQLRRVQLEDGEAVEGDAFVNTIPTEVYRRFAPIDDTPALPEIRYTAIVSAICVTSQPVRPEFCWMNLASLDCSASGIFRLESLNPSIGGPGETCLNFVTHVPHRDDPFLARSDDELRQG